MTDEQLKVYIEKGSEVFETVIAQSAGDVVKFLVFRNRAGEGEAFECYQETLSNGLEEFGPSFAKSFFEMMKSSDA